MTNRDALLKKFGSPEAVSAHYKEMQRKSMQNPNKQKGNFKGGFKAIPTEYVKELSRRGVEARQKKSEDEG